VLPRVSGRIVAAEPVEDDPDEPSTLFLAVLVRADAPQEAHDQQDVGGVEAGSHGACGDAGVQELGDGGDDRGIGLVDRILDRCVVQGLAEAVLEPDAVGEGLEPGYERVVGCAAWFRAAARRWVAYVLRVLSLVIGCSSIFRAPAVGSNRLAETSPRSFRYCGECSALWPCRG
jgi:hypothetical protein